MIVAERKPLEEIYQRLRDAGRVLLVGCGECVTVCSAGGEKEVGLLAQLLAMRARKDGRVIEITPRTVHRQCDREFVEPLVAEVTAADLVVSMACGSGVQLMAEVFGDAEIVPALNTCFIGATVAEGSWSERCSACGDCIVDRFGDICPRTRCAKGLLNGPCGGSQDGKCEVGDDRDCAWQLIIDRMARLGRLSELAEYQEPADWSVSLHGGPRRIDREDLKK